MNIRFIFASIVQMIAYALIVPAGPCLAQTSLADQIDGYVTLSSADVFRGINRNNHDVNAMVGLRYKFNDEWMVGARFNRTQFPSGPQQFANQLEFNHFVAWSKPVTENVEIELRFSRYTYPGSNDPIFEYDYNELMLTAILSSNFSASLSLSDTSFAFANGNTYGEVGWRKALPWDLELSAAWGGVDTNSRFLNDYAYWDVGVSKAFGPIVADLRYHDSPSDGFWIGREKVNQQWAFSLTTGW